MLYWIYQLWHEAFQAEKASGSEGWAHAMSFLNLFQYITFRAGMACLLAFVVSLLCGERLIRRLISLKVGQPIRSAEEVHKLAELHGNKAGTPTMGGIMIIGTVLLSVLLCARLINPFVLVTTFVMLGLGLLGFCDDYYKVVKKNSDGISPRGKLFWQLLIALAAALFIFFNPEIAGPGMKEGKELGFFLSGQHFAVSEVTFPLFKSPLIDLKYLVIPFFVVIIIGSSNAVNLTDGLDGLATGCTITVTLAYSAIAYMAGNIFASSHLSIAFNPMVGELAVFLLALVGACFGFLWFNCHPAKVFMGDTGSLAIGGALGTVAICTKQEFLLVLIGGIFVMEAVSVILQVGSYKLRKKRIFRMAPIHHHFELGGWKESQVIIRFWIISIILSLVGLSLLKIV